MVDGSTIYAVVIGLTIIERICELVVARRNAAWSFSKGGVEFGQSHYPWMVSMHVSFLICCVLEPIVFHRPFVFEVAGPLLVVAVLCQLLRWWVIVTLGRRWNTRVIVVPGLERVTTGPFRFFSHPNYLAVVIETAVLPMIHTSWCTAVVFSILNAFVLWGRVHCENSALKQLSHATPG